MASTAHSRPSASRVDDDFVGVIYGDVGSTAFRCSVVGSVERHEFVQVRHDTCGTVLGRVEEVERKTDLSLERAQHVGDREPVHLEEDKRHGAYIGLLAGHDVPVYLVINTMVQKHVSIIAKTGGGKSYAAGVLIEEVMKHHVTTVILDPHGEYASLS